MIIEERHGINGKVKYRVIPVSNGWQVQVRTHFLFIWRYWMNVGGVWGNHESASLAAQMAMHGDQWDKLLKDWNREMLLAGVIYGSIMLGIGLLMYYL